MRDWTIKETTNLSRIDVFLQSETEFSRNYIQNLIKEGLVLVNEKTTKANYIIKPGDVVVMVIPKQKKIALEPVNLNLEVVYEDEYLAVINKPKGLVVHPSDSFMETTLVSGLLYQFDKLSNDPIKPGIVHRLDKDTSGLLIIAKDDETLKKLQNQFKNRTISKIYLAICYGEFKTFNGTIDKPIIRHPKKRQQMTTALTGRRAVTHYKVLSQNNGYSYIELDLITGRTHQIRVHLKSINHPILGDPVYGPKKVYGSVGPYLHAYKLSFNHPITKRRLELTSEPPAVFINELINRRLVDEERFYN